MTFDLSIIFDIPECQYFAALRCHVAFAFKIRNHRALRCKQRCVASKANVAFAFKIRNHRALRCFLYLSNIKHNNVYNKYVGVQNISSASMANFKNVIGRSDLLSQLDLNHNADLNDNYNMCSILTKGSTLAPGCPLRNYRTKISFNW